MNWFGDFVSLIFPKICVCCGNSLWKNEEIICRLCDYHLPRTNFHLDPGNPVSYSFLGRASIENATAFLYFNKGNKVQQLIHHLKYKERRDVGIYMGVQYGRQLLQSPLYKSMQTIIPVPLHKKKQKQRGYNQSEQFAIGLAESMNLSVSNNNLIRVKATATQTKKSRFNRYMNVSEIFTVSNPQSLQGKHILLVDDVITTGATLESCIHAMSVIPGCKISVACIAAAML
ncbi:MAG: ComF family protein [Bacteroidales bacterium]|jgi:ComF family protein|nr:ComF family protein [Bacteroidales bacterium]